ncbi:hypothetical protein, partial [Micromonospora sonneratiae]
QQHHLDIAGLRQEQGRLSFSGLRDQPGSGTPDSPTPDSPTPDNPDGDTPADRSNDVEQERGAGSPVRTPEPTHTTSPIPDSGFVPDGRPTHLPGGGRLRGVADVLDLAARHEPGISWAVDEAAAVGDVAESRPGRPGSEVGVRSWLRYSVEFPSVGYADGVRRTVEGLVARGYQPVRLVDGWAAGDVGGLVSQWRDPGTGQEFRVR